MAELMNQAGLPAPENETAAGEEDAYLLKSCGLAKYARKVENICCFIASMVENSCVEHCYQVVGEKKIDIMTDGIRVTSAENLLGALI